MSLENSSPNQTLIALHYGLEQQLALLSDLSSIVRRRQLVLDTPATSNTSDETWELRGALKISQELTSYAAFCCSVYKHGLEALKQQINIAPKEDPIRSLKKLEKLFADIYHEEDAQLALEDFAVRCGKDTPDAAVPDLIGYPEQFGDVRQNPATLQIDAEELIENAYVLCEFPASSLVVQKEAAEAILPLLLSLTYCDGLSTEIIMKNVNYIIDHHHSSQEVEKKLDIITDKNTDVCVRFDNKEYTLARFRLEVLNPALLIAWGHIKNFCAESYVELKTKYTLRPQHEERARVLHQQAKALLSHGSNPELHTGAFICLIKQQTQQM